MLLTFGTLVLWLVIYCANRSDFDCGYRHGIFSRIGLCFGGGVGTVAPSAAMKRKSISQRSLHHSAYHW